MRFRGDRERFIGSYDPEYEMPDPDRERGGRFQSEASRNASRDSRYFYRLGMMHERERARRAAEGRFDRFEGDARDLDRARGWGRDDHGRSSFNRSFDRGSYDRPIDRGYGYGVSSGRDDEYDRYRDWRERERVWGRDEDRWRSRDRDDEDLQPGWPNRERDWW